METTAKNTHLLYLQKSLCEQVRSNKMLLLYVVTNFNESHGVQYFALFLRGAKANG